MARSSDVSMLLPFFQHYLDRGTMPDGGGVLDQPVALINAFELFVSVFRRFEKEDFDRRLKSGSKA
jgi:hypothetical protein